VDLLRFLSQRLRPSSYLEVGTQSGDSVAVIECDAICVNPDFVISQNIIKTRRRTFLFQMMSDDFFADYDLRVLFPRGVDMTFLDGLHRVEFLLRDFS